MFMSRRMEQTIVNTSEITAAEGAALMAAGIRHGEDLSMVAFEDISEIMTGASTVKR